MGVGRNGDVSAIEARPSQCLFDASIRMLNTPPGSELARLIDIGIDYRGKQQIGKFPNGFCVGVSDRASADKTDSLSRKTCYL